MATRTPPQDRALTLEPVPDHDCARCWGNDWQIGAFRWWCGECGADEGEAPPEGAGNAPGAGEDDKTVPGTPNPERPGEKMT